MGIIIDIVLIAILLLSAFLGYKKGLVKLGAGLFAGIIAIIATIIIYKPVSGVIIKHTPIDDKIKEAIVQNTTNFIDEKSQVPEAMTNQVKSEMLPEEAGNISKSIVYAITSLVLFVVVKIALSIVISLMDFVANLPILKQFNEAGGIAYGVIRGALIVCVCVLLMGVYTKMKPESALNDKIESSVLTKMLYENIVKF